MDGLLSQVFTHMDAVGGARGGRLTAVANIVMPEGDLVTVRAGGPGVRATYQQGSWVTYEVLISGDPPRFWHRYAANSTDSIFANVPPLLITHHVTRSGGIAHLELLSQERARTGIMDLRLVVAEGSDVAVRSALALISGAQVLTSRFSLQE